MLDKASGKNLIKTYLILYLYIYILPFFTEPFYTLQFKEALMQESMAEIRSSKGSKVSPVQSENSDLLSSGTHPSEGKIINNELESTIIREKYMQAIDSSLIRQTSRDRKQEEMLADLLVRIKPFIAELGIDTSDDPIHLSIFERIVDILNKLISKLSVIKVERHTLEVFKQDVNAALNVLHEKHDRNIYVAVKETMEKAHAEEQMLKENITKYQQELEFFKDYKKHIAKMAKSFNEIEKMSGNVSQPIFQENTDLKKNYKSMHNSTNDVSMNEPKPQNCKRQLFDRIKNSKEKCESADSELEWVISSKYYRQYMEYFQDCTRRTKVSRSTSKRENSDLPLSLTQCDDTKRSTAETSLHADSPQPTVSTAYQTDTQSIPLFCTEGLTCSSQTDKPDFDPSQISHGNLFDKSSATLTSGGKVACKPKKRMTRPGPVLGLKSEPEAKSNPARGQMKNKLK